MSVARRSWPTTRNLPLQPGQRTFTTRLVYQEIRQDCADPLPDDPPPGPRRYQPQLLTCALGWPNSGQTGDGNVVDMGAGKAVGAGVVLEGGDDPVLGLDRREPGQAGALHELEGRVVR